MTKKKELTEELKELVPKKAAAMDLFNLQLLREKFIISSIVAISITASVSAVSVPLSAAVTVIYCVAAAIRLKAVRAEIARLKTTYQL